MQDLLDTLLKVIEKEREIKEDRELKARTDGLTESLDRNAHLSRDTGMVLRDNRFGVAR